MRAHGEPCARIAAVQGVLLPLGAPVPGLEPAAAITPVLAAAALRDPVRRTGLEGSAVSMEATEECSAAAVLAWRVLCALCPGLRCVSRAACGVLAVFGPAAVS